jgi:hypothetical protein
LIPQGFENVERFPSVWMNIEVLRGGVLLFATDEDHPVV